MKISLHLADIYKTYLVSPSGGLFTRGRPTQVLKQVSLRGQGGEVIAFLGPNGSGKTTLLKIAAGLVNSTSGQVIIESIPTEISNAGREESSLPYRTFYLPAEERGFYARLSVAQNLRFFRRLFCLSDPAAERLLQEFIQAYGLNPFLDKRYQELSAGQKHLVGLALAFSVPAPVIMLDEPLRHLDPLLAKKLATDLRERLVEERGKLLLFASQSIEIAASLADRVALLKGGELGGTWPLEQLVETGEDSTQALSRHYRKLVGED